MGHFFFGLFVGTGLMLFLVGEAHREKYIESNVQQRAQNVYTDWANSRDWYDREKHLEPWSRLSEAEREQWLRPLRKYEVSK